MAWPSLENFFLVYPLKRFALNLFLTLGVLLSSAWIFSETTANRREILLAAATSIAALFLVLAAIEAPAAMNAIDYRPVLLPKVAGSSGPHNRVFRPEGYFARPPYDAFTEERPGDFAVTINVKTDRIYRSEYVYDGDGFRNSEDMAEPDVFVLGDSFAEGYLVDQGEALAAQLADLGGLCARSLGISDFSTYHARSALRAMMPDSGAPVVVWLIFEGNDVPAPGYSYRAFLDDYGTGEKSTYADRSFVLNAARIFAFWTARLTRNMTDPDYAKTLSATLGDIPWDSETAIYFTMKPPLDLEARLPGLLENLEETHVELAERGAKLLVALVPVKFGVFHQLLRFPPESTIATWSTSGLAEALTGWSRETRIAFLDLGPALSRAAAEGDLPYYLDDAHWSASGHRIAAQAITRELRDRGWIEGSADGTCALNRNGSGTHPIK